jgi:5-methyltetrahydrofolate--homocysteine methyltransferase
MNAIDLLNLRKAIIEGDARKTVELTKAAIKEEISANDILHKGLVPGIREIGELFGKGECYLPELIVSGKAMEAAIEQLEPLFGNGESFDTGRFLIGTVKGDVHDIGKKIVTMMLKGNRWKVTDLGVDISPEQFCKAVREGNYNILGMSALLTTTMPNAASTIRSLEDARLRNKIKVIVGGAPVTQEFADKIGADAYGKDAWDAVIKAEKLLSNCL